MTPHEWKWHRKDHEGGGDWWRCYRCGFWVCMIFEVRPEDSSGIPGRTDCDDRLIDGVMGS